ncbi:MAG TPA: F0F1 ATP synthase subunit epsilon [Actinobacteria bacterium]|nr:F0F1 ATP synthase subunit epsilon [Actinomycetota bacterium]HCK79460.1 F0F1 ATP synthase subunit epsilon [Actinomycetota bacterium]
MVALLQVELVAADRMVWSGNASLVLARTLDGDIGVLPGHQPVLAILAGSTVTVRTPDGTVSAAVHGGFFSVADNRVSILAESAELAEEIDVERAQRAAERARTAGAEDDLMRAETRIRVASL